MELACRMSPDRPAADSYAVTMMKRPNQLTMFQQLALNENSSIVTQVNYSLSSTLS